MPKHKHKAKPRPSLTAWIVAAATLYLSHHPTLYGLVPVAAIDPTRRALRAGRGIYGRLFTRLINHAWFRKRLAAKEQRTLPGFALHIAARKLYIEAAVRRAVAQEFGQVIVLGAGYDTLALRLHAEFPKVMFIEVDHHATQRVKTRTALAPHLPAPNLAVVAADLGGPGLADALAACPIYRPGADTLFIAEGLLMYLPPQSVEALIKELRDIGAPVALPGARHSPPRPRGRTRLVFSFLEVLDDGHIGFPNTPESFDRWLAKREPFRWGIERSKLPEWLAQRGFAVTEIAGSQTLRQRVLAGKTPEDEPMAQGEFLCTADRK